MVKLFKLLGWALVLSGICVVFLDRSPNAELPLLVGLFTVFIAGKKTEDERSQQLKSSSAYIALVLSYATKLISSNLYEHHILSFSLSDINYFLILVFGMAIILFYARLYLSAR
ncbi:hypothetical protein GCM10007423_01190 [Dyadobacter endophyticus]|uniref:Uncharacterized protein n=1 Tax=Dyadobacter endophyticus TaxID=1749036 RepID=A0ABQ1YCH1_9BACT|nr:hypothetical protein [Dyadobacter endophyticus]GGH20677.1 hypothetical protein GCM10007423_01190 [Dyadobacter endophyticus]